MAKKYIERYNSFCNSLNSLKQAKYRNLSDDFVLSGTVRKFNLTFDISWKVMADIIVKYHQISDFATGSPRETIRTAYRVGLIHSDLWLHMLKDRNELTHDYDGSLAVEKANDIIQFYIPLFEEFRTAAASYTDRLQEDLKF